MLFTDAEGAIRFLQALRDRCAGRWADLFAERRCILRIIEADGPEAGATEAWDAGVGLRVVRDDAAILHSSSTGLGGESLEAAARGLRLAGDARADRRTRGIAGRNRLGCGDPGAAAADRAGLADPRATEEEGEEGEAVHRWVSDQSRLLRPFLQQFSNALSRESPSLRTRHIEALISCQAVTHVSSDTPVARDRRTGVLVTVHFAGPRGSPAVRRRWGAASAEDLLATCLPLEEAPRMEEARRRISEARPAPHGTFPVVFASGSGGLLFHEAVGHLLEGDLIRRGGSCLSPHPTGELEGKDQGERPLLSPLITIADHPGSLPGRGSYRLDDEGIAPRRAVLVEEGRVRGWVGDRWNSPGTTGHGRRQSHRDPPLPRLAATVCAAGPHDPVEIVRETPKGIHVDELRGGWVDPSSGDFVLHAAEGRLIEDGRLTTSLRDLLILGNACTSLFLIDRVGHDVTGNGGTHSCVRSGQSVATIVGMPTLRIARIRVAGMDTK